MKAPTKLLTAIASALMAFGFSASVHAEAVTHTFEDGSVLHVFDDGSMSTFDPSSGYASATPAIDDATQIAAVESEVSQELAGRSGMDVEESVGATVDSVEGAIGGSSIEGHWTVQVPSGSAQIDD